MHDDCIYEFLRKSSPAGAALVSRETTRHKSRPLPPLELPILDFKRPRGPHSVMTAYMNLLEMSLSAGALHGSLHQVLLAQGQRLTI